MLCLLLLLHLLLIQVLHVRRDLLRLRLLRRQLMWLEALPSCGLSLPSQR